MAIITTRVTLGWYGIEDEVPCTTTSLPDLIGTYNASGQFIQGTSELPESEAQQISVNSFTSSGAPDRWDISIEKDYRNSTPQFIELDHLKCGRMYYIVKQTESEFEIPNFVPAANGVDMGRVA